MKTKKYTKEQSDEMRRQELLCYKLEDYLEEHSARLLGLSDSYIAESLHVDLDVKKEVSMRYLSDLEMRTLEAVSMAFYDSHGIMW